MLNNKTKHKKYGQDWQKNLKWLSHSLGKDNQTKFITQLEATVKKSQEKQEIQKEINKLESEKSPSGYSGSAKTHPTENNCFRN